MSNELDLPVRYFWCLRGSHRCEYWAWTVDHADGMLCSWCETCHAWVEVADYSRFHDLEIDEA